MTPRWRVLLTEEISSEGMALLRENAELVMAGSSDPAELAREVADADAVVLRSSPLPRSVIEAGHRLRVIGRHGAGVENIDLAAASERGIPVVHTPGANAHSVAEFVIMAAMVMSRKLPRTVAAFHGGSFPAGTSLPAAVSSQGLLGRTIPSQTVGVVGLGAIGREVARLARALGATVTAFDPLVADAPDGVQLGTFDEVVRAADVLTLHVPLTAGTRHLISAAQIRHMRPGAVLINTARAGVVDAPAVLDALDRDALGGYCVDVFDPEPPPSDDPLLHHPKVYATPHMAAMTHEAMRAMAVEVASGVLAVLGGDRAVPIANREALDAR